MKPITYVQDLVFPPVEQQSYFNPLVAIIDNHHGCCQWNFKFKNGAKTEIKASDPKYEQWDEKTIDKRVKKICLWYRDSDS